MIISLYWIMVKIQEAKARGESEWSTGGYGDLHVNDAELLRQQGYKFMYFGPNDLTISWENLND